jgi:group II intron reverse transcriptase/maturase
LNPHGAAGIDGEAVGEFEKNLEERVTALLARLKAGQYRAPPVRRVEIPKGRNQTRPLGIPTVEDRLLQKAVARIVEAIFEQDFREVSFGYRPGRNAHQALCVLRRHIVRDKVMQVYEADIRGYFTHLNHEWLQTMIRHRIADPVILRLIGKWLKAGVMTDGVLVRTEEGTPQGGCISPILANVYLHFVLDLWFEKKFKPRCRGEAYLIRFVDDFVACFQYQGDAIAFGQALEERMRKFGLELAPEKTRLLTFGRFAKEREQQSKEKAGSFVFLGFNHVGGVDRSGKFALIRLPSKKSCRKFLDQTHEWLKRHSHWKRRDQQAHLTMRLKGFYQYFSLHHCRPRLNWILREVQRQWIRTLRRRSQRHRLYWSYLRSRDWFVLPYPPTTLHPQV